MTADEGIHPMHSLGRLRHACVAAAPPLAVMLVGGLIGGAVLTGRPVHAADRVAARAAGAAGAADPSTVAQVSLGRFDSVALRTASHDDSGDVARALAVLGPPERADDARSSRSAQRAPLHRWVRPNDGPLTSPFGYRWGRLHAGIDLAGAYGSPILAATDGCITYAGPMDGYGEVMKIQDWDGTETVYGHMSAFVRTSGCVKAGAVIARVGAAGDATGAHLHFEVHVGGAPVNPIPFLAKRHLFI